MRLIRDVDCGSWRIWLEVEIRRVDCPRCHKVKTETLSWLSQSGRQTERFVQRVGRRCREASISSVAEEFGLHWDTVKSIDIQYMQRQLKDHPLEPPAAIGIDEISVRKGHEYRIVVHDLVRRRPIWFGGFDRSGKSMDEFYASLGIDVCRGIRLGVMDMWLAFRTSFQAHCPNGKVAYDHFHICQHLGKAIDLVRRAEYKRVDGAKRRFIKGQRYHLLSNRENLDAKGRLELEALLKVNNRLNKAYLLKESFDQLWSYKSPAWARKFFDGWKKSLRWQRLKPLEKFAAMIDKHWDGIVAMMGMKEKIPMGFVEGMNNKIRTIQRRAYGIKDEDYLRLKVLTMSLPKW